MSGGTSANHRTGYTPSRMNRRVRFLAASATLSLPGTYLAAQIDFVRRHSPGMAPERYWLPQLLHIWLPGLAATLIFALGAFALHRRARGD
jgi:hypothetical protein